MAQRCVRYVHVYIVCSLNTSVIHSTVYYTYTVYCIVYPTLNTVLETKMRIHKVQVTKETPVLVVEEDPVVMEKVSPTTMSFNTAWTCGEEGVLSTRLCNRLAGQSYQVENRLVFLICSQVRNADL